MTDTELMKYILQAPSRQHIIAKIKECLRQVENNNQYLYELGYKEGLDVGRAEIRFTGESNE